MKWIFDGYDTAVNFDKFSRITVHLQGSGWHVCTSTNDDEELLKVFKTKPEAVNYIRGLTDLLNGDD